jgi:Tol biopolymer transport system component
MNSTSAQALPGTEDARRPFWSPDSRYLAFIAGGKLKKVPVSGGPPITICDAPNGADGTWGRGGVILYDGGPNDPILRVSASGGVPATAISGDTAKQVGWPEFLPDGKHFLYLAIGAESRLLVGQLGSPTGRDLGACESQVQFVPPGYLLFSRGGSLVVQPFDLRALKIKGEPVPVAEQVGTSSVGGSDFRASDNGALVYSARSTVEGELVELARDGRPIRKIPGAANSLHPKLSPDQRRIAIRVLDAQTRTRDIWLVDLAREITSRFTFEPGNENLPLWSPDGKRIAFVSDDSKATGICVRNVSGSGDRELLGRVSANVVPTDWSPDGATIVFEDGTPATRSDLWLLPLEGDRKPRPFLNGSYNEAQGRFSPDGRYLAYTSDESGRPEIYVQAFPDRSEKWQISTRGGSDPEWSADGRELFYLGSDQQMMSVAVHGEPTLTMELPRALFPARVAQPIGPRNHYAVSRDGQRFFVLAARDNRSIPPVNVMTNWIAELQRR